MTMGSLAIRMVCNDLRRLVELVKRATRLLVVATLTLLPSSLPLLATLVTATDGHAIATHSHQHSHQRPDGPTVLSVGPLVVVAVCLGSALLSYKTFVIAPAIEAQIGVVAFALGLHQTILGEIEEAVAEGYHACGATRTLPSPYHAACRGFATTHQG